MVLAWLGCFWLCRELAARRRIDPDWKLSWALACAGWGALLTFLTEGSSLARAFNAPVLRLAWWGVDLALLGSAAVLARSRHALSRAGFRRWLDAVRMVQEAPWPRDAKLFLAATVLLAAFLFGLALSFATTNWDSLTYHLPRMMHWIQNQSVNHFPTNNSRQIEFAPWSSFVLAHLLLLSGEDRLLNLVQWVAMISSLIVVAWIVKQLALAAGASELAGSSAPSRRLTAFAVLLVVTIPIGLVESINPQTDYTAAFWLCGLVAFTLALLAEPANRWYALGAGLSCGLGVLTKATTFLYAAPWIVVAGPCLLFRARTGRDRVLLAVLFSGAFVSLNAPHMLRNDALYGSPLGSPTMFARERNERVTAPAVFSNILRNLALHNGSGIAPVTRALNWIAARAHRLTGQDLNDPATTYHVGKFQFPENFLVYDSYASGTFHVLLIGLALCLACRAPIRNRRLWCYAGLILTSFVLFCAYLKWQQWHVRIHLAYFVLLMPFVALLLCQRCPRWVPALASGVVLLFGACTLARNLSRPIGNPGFVTLPRENQSLFVHGQPINGPYGSLASAIVASHCRVVGLKLGFDDAEYPLWVMLRNRGFRGEMHHIFVEDNSFRLDTGDVPPEVIVAGSGTPPASVRMQYPFQTTFGDFVLLSRTSIPRLPSAAPVGATASLDRD